jgi:glycosyltransferase involved in cell wall biosynthesis
MVADIKATRALKVMFFLGFPNPFPGAGWTRTHFFANTLSTRGHVVDIVGTWTPKSEQRGYRRIDLVNCFNFIPSIDFKNFLLFFLEAFVTLIVATIILLVRRPCIVIISIPPADIGLGSYLASAMLRRKTIIDLRDEWEDYMMSSASSKMGKLYYHFLKKVTPYIYNKCAYVFAVTTIMFENLKKRGIKNAKLIINGADIKTFKPLGEPKKNKIFKIIYVGVVGEYYRLDVVLKAFKILIQKGFKNFKLIIWGGMNQKLFNLVRDLQLLDKIAWKAPTIDKTILARSIAQADIGLIPYDDNPLWKSTIPAKFYEYCACGIPVIATTHNDSLLAEIINRYNIGITSPPLNEEKLADAILRLYQDENFRKTAGEKARKLIEEKFDRNKIAEECLHLIEDVL